MLAKNKRLNLKKDFAWVAAGEKKESSLVKLFFRFSQEGKAKVGIATSSKTFKTAVLRNRARRVLSYGFEVLYGRLRNGVKVVAIPKVAILQQESDKVVIDLEKLLKKADLIN